MNKIIIDGKEYELSDELTEKIKAEVSAQAKAENPFERKADDEGYFYVNERGEVKPAIDRYFSMDNGCFQVANYCRDRGMMEQRALHETLNRLLWRYSETHGGDAWDMGIGGFYIRRWTDDGFKAFFCGDGKMNGVVFFADRDTAEAAIEEVVKPFMEAHPEFVW